MLFGLYHSGKYIVSLHLRHYVGIILAVCKRFFNGYIVGIAYGSTPDLDEFLTIVAIEFIAQTEHSVLAGHC